MEVFQTIKVLVSGDKIEAVKSAIINKAEVNGWINKPKLEKDYSKNTMFIGTVLVIESPDLNLNDKILKANLWMRTDNNAFVLFNIIPLKTRQLSYTEYNFILSRFYKIVVSPVTKQMGIDTVISNPERLIQDVIGNDDVFNLLYRFSRSANKSTGNSDPMDFDRWSDFVITAFREKVKLNTDVLVRWLEEDEKWDNETAWELGLQYEYALQILSKYEQSR